LRFASLEIAAIAAIDNGDVKRNQSRKLGDFYIPKAGGRNGAKILNLGRTELLAKDK